MDSKFQISAYEMRPGQYACVCCVYNTRAGEGCRYKERGKDHMENVVQLLMNCKEIATILVGPEKSRLSCHKALLGFYSEFFDGALYGGFAEAKDSIVEMPEETVVGMATFITWCYTGRVDSTLGGEQLWVLGDRLGSPQFSNEAMFFLFDLYNENYIPAQAADYVYSNTVPQSVLRKLISDLIVAVGPLSGLKRSDMNHSRKSQFRQDWHDLILGGGELVLDVIKRDYSFSQNDQDQWNETLYLGDNAAKYILEVNGRPIEDFLSGRKRKS